MLVMFLTFPSTKDSINVGVQLNGGSTNYFTITIEDVNDNPPMFDGDQGSQISLDVPEVCGSYANNDTSLLK